MPPNQNRPGVRGPGPIESQSLAGNGISAFPSLDLDHFRARVLQDALTSATAAYWIRRAETFEAAAPRKGDYHGVAEPDELLERWERCKATAQACRRHAALILEGMPEEISPDVWAVLDEAA